MYTVKQTHQDNDYRNLPHNKILRRDYVVNLIAYKAEGKKIFYVDETNFNFKGSNIHVIACISEDGLAYSEKRFGSYTSDECNKFIRRLLRHIGQTTPLDNIVPVCDNAPCHTSIEEVFDEEEFAPAKLLRLGPYSPMLNPIENCFSTFKSMVKCFLARHRQAILQVPPHLTIKQHREGYLKMAADLLVGEAITPYICYKCTLHTMKFHARAMPVGE
ncbi:hypothetical protein PHYSODRAFT_504225 [Phytophthora sojae]|uniref:Tc1-like transposase DDE domain-containing protein n=1 Tax=Phytophthora sojae (strain P6497) TaxID=1094619 RepID=G4ZGW1_PHYSP|nr:hypothetical protein PHYSODRAFT_504225 [Phytophthora sojae]EGZ18027.1 hypothetical protein PHYSODRAFT_504225 [Phytophthora sojae]|eukprot:XP_009527085.1 hypothetical protein PHYSODRAFT_504225 [Phytophthora sojae]